MTPLEKAQQKLKEQQAKPATPVAPAKQPATPAPLVETAPPAPAATAAPPIPNAGWMDWLAQKGQTFRDWNRALDNRVSLGGLDYLFSQLPSPAKTQSGLSTADFLAQERAKTQAARENIGPLGRASADVIGTGLGLSRLIPGGPIAQGGVGNAVQAAVEGRDARDIVTSGVEGALWGGLSIPLNKYVFNPAMKYLASRNWGPIGTGTPSDVVYPYVKPGQTSAGGEPSQAPTLGGVPGFRDPRYPANMTAQDLANAARELETMPKATGEGADAQNAMREILQHRINTVATQGTPTNGTPGSGLNKVNQAYWDAGGPPKTGDVDALSPVEKGVTRAVGAGVGGVAGHWLDVPGLREAGAIAGADYAPRLYAALASPSGASVYPGFATRPPSAQQALSNLLIGAGPDVDQYMQRFWPTPGQ